MISGGQIMVIDGIVSDYGFNAANHEQDQK